MRQLKQIACDWTFLEHFSWSVPKISWSSANVLIDALRKTAEAQQKHRNQIVEQWNELFSDFGGDPIIFDWKKFRPLRREEDWSDWLAHLLETSETGLLAHLLFGRIENASRKPKVEREPEIGPYQADLLIDWTETEGSHVEIKIGDLRLEKTIGECEELQKESERGDRSGVFYDHWILLPRQHLPRWDEVVAEHSASPLAKEVHSIDWHKVVVSIRRALRHAGESMPWRVWAWTFLGIIHQRHMGHPRFCEQETADPSLLLDMTEILEKGLIDEQ